MSNLITAYANEPLVQDDTATYYVPDRIALQAAAAGKAHSVVAGSEILTYHELEQQANRLARHLLSLGVGPNVPVALCLERSLAFVVSALAIMNAAAAYVPIDPGQPGERIGFMLEDVGTPLLVTHSAIAQTLPQGRWRVVNLDIDAHEIARHAPDSLGTAVRSGEQIAYVIYTSGSTGRPKGVQITHANLLNLVQWHQRAFDVTAADRATQLAGVGFDAAVWELWPYLAAGATIHIPDELTRKSADALQQWLVREAITISFVPTAMAESLIRLCWPHETPLRILLTGGDSLHSYPASDLPFAVVNNYGPTECTVVATSGVIRPEDASDTPPPIGGAISNVSVHLLDEQLNPVAPGEAGELCVGGAGVGAGYVNRPELTATKFVRDPFGPSPSDRLYRTGDLARLLPDGQIAFLGRADDQIKIRGYRIEPHEIECVLSRHPSVAACVVVAREDAGDKRLVAYVALADMESSAGELRQFVADRLPDYMVPAVLVRLDSLPLTNNGKIDRSVLPQPDRHNTLAEAHLDSPTSEVEQGVAGILRALLGVEEIGADDNFFLLGGHSLLGTQVIARVRDLFGVELSLHSIFESPTVASLSTEIERLIMSKIENVREASPGAAAEW